MADIKSTITRHIKKQEISAQNEGGNQFIDSSPHRSSGRPEKDLKTVIVTAHCRSK